MAHGGARPGAGRKRGSKNKRELNWNGELLADPGSVAGAAIAAETSVDDIMDTAKLAKMSPLSFLLAIMRNPRRGMDVRVEAAKTALPYAHPRLSQPRDDQPGFAGLDGAGDGWGDDLPRMTRN